MNTVSKRGRPKKIGECQQVGLRIPTDEIPELNRAVALDARSKGIPESRNNFLLQAARVEVNRVLSAAGEDDKPSRPSLVR